ncbi:lichenase-2-like isoform X2 [Triticum dicoccoides]|uniref:lichenase-2-like isoform X2 n=1 Tax=Triticum dicoccoides TaxID=85692 RepID=UPI001891708E|nr:lichenase-2-like isoform X2 [Triticum dicoccoides]
MASQGVASMLPLALLLGAYPTIPYSHAVVESIGVCYGMSANNLPAASTVVGMFKSNGIKSMRLYAPDKAALQAVGGTGIYVVVGAPNDVLSNLAASPAAAASWVRSNIQAYPKVSFRYVCVGNEVAGGATRNLVPAMKNVHGALTSAGLGHIKVTTSVSQAILGVYSPPSAGSFTAEAAAFMGPVVQFLARTRAPLMANIYPYLAWAYNPSAMDMSYALFTASGTVVQDGGFGYQNLFDTTMDAFYTAMAKHGGSNVKLVVSESGWPSGGGTAATPANARFYNQHLINHVGRGTPRHQGAIETYIFAMFNENQKTSGVEQHWGLFYPNMQHVYPINF